VFSTCTLVYHCQVISTFLLLLSHEFWVIETPNRSLNVTVNRMAREGVSKAHESELTKVYVFKNGRTQKSRTNFMRSEHDSFCSGTFCFQIGHVPNVDFVFYISSGN
jgi:hypothetical protein